MNGCQACQYIRETLQLNKETLPIIALTAYTDIIEVEKYIKAGMNDYQSKPFEANDLCRKIKQHLVKNQGNL